MRTAQGGTQGESHDLDKAHGAPRGRPRIWLRFGRDKCESLARVSLLGSGEPRSQTSLWRQQDSTSAEMREILVSVRDAVGGGALLWSPQQEGRPGGQRTAPEPRVTASPKGAEQGPGAPPAPPGTEGKGVAFHSEGQPFLAGPSGPPSAEGGSPALALEAAPPAPSSRPADAGPQDACGWKSQSLTWGSSPRRQPQGDPPSSLHISPSAHAASAQF